MADTATITTDDLGRFAFDSTLDTGLYVIEGNSGDTAFCIIDSVWVVNKDSTVEVEDTLKAPGTITGVVYLPQGGDLGSVYVLVFGVNRFALPDSTGSFTLDSLAEGCYDLRVVSSLPDYGVFDTASVCVVSGGVTGVDSLRVPYTGIPVPTGLVLTYDTLKQIVTLSWESDDTTVVKYYNLYRRNVDSNTVLARLNESPVTDTVFVDSNCVQDQTYEYVLAAVSITEVEGQKCAASQVIIASHFAVVASFNDLGSGAGQFDRPTDIVQAPNGNIYIVEYGNNRVQVFDSSMQSKREFGSAVLSKPFKIALSITGKAYVLTADITANSLYIFDSTGIVTDSIRIASYPSINADVDIDSGNLVMLTNGDSTSYVTCYDLAGTKKRSWACGDYNSSWALAVHSPGRVLVANHYENRVTVFDTLGGVISTLNVEEPNVATNPDCIAVDKHKERLFVVCVSSLLGNKLKVFDSSSRLIADYTIPCRSGKRMAMALLQSGLVALTVEASQLDTPPAVLLLRSLLP
jgi:hypothetical protein